MAHDKNDDKYYLSSEDAQPILDDILRSCHLVPNSLPLDVLEANAKTTLAAFRCIRILCIVSVFLCFILPVLLLKPSLKFSPAFASGERTLFEFTVHSLLPMKSVEATLNGHALPVNEVGNNTYRIDIDASGELTVTAVSMNNQSYTSSVQVSPLHLKPEITESHLEGDAIVIQLKEGSYPIDFSNIYAVSLTGERVDPIAVDEAARTVTFDYPAEALNIYIYDIRGSSIVAVLNVFHSKGASGNVFPYE